MDEIRFTPLRPVQPPEVTAPGSSGKTGEVSFQDVLSDALKQIDGLQNRATEATAASFDPSDPAALHEVMIAVEEANIAFQFALQVRNRLVEAYNEVMRMQV